MCLAHMPKECVKEKSKIRNLYLCKNVYMTFKDPTNDGCGYEAAWCLAQLWAGLASVSLAGWGLPWAGEAWVRVEWQGKLQATRWATSLSEGTFDSPCLRFGPRSIWPLSPVPSTFHCFTDVLLASNSKTLTLVFCTTPCIGVNKLPAKTPLERGLSEVMLQMPALPSVPLQRGRCLWDAWWDFWVASMSLNLQLHPQLRASLAPARWGICHAPTTDMGVPMDVTCFWCMPFLLLKRLSCS